MVFVADIIDFREILMKAPLPIATIQRAVIDFLRGRQDAVLFGAQAVNAYAGEPRATQDVDLLSPRAREFAEELRAHLAERFGIAARVREVKDGAGYRIYQLQQTANRLLVDVRSVDVLPRCRRLDDVLVLPPEELVASKVVAYFNRKGKPKSGTDWRDIAVLLLAFPELRADTGAVATLLESEPDSVRVLTVWRDLVAQPIVPEEPDDEF